jgi:hypothetical protein
MQTARTVTALAAGFGCGVRDHEARVSGVCETIHDSLVTVGALGRAHKTRSGHRGWPENHTADRVAGNNQEYPRREDKVAEATEISVCFFFYCDLLKLG